MTCPLSCLYRALLPCLLSCPPVVPSLHAPCHALPCPPVVPSLLPCPRRAFPVVRSCRPLPLPCPCRTFPVVHPFLRSCRARSLRNEIHWLALSCTTVVPVLTFPSPHHSVAPFSRRPCRVGAQRYAQGHRQIESQAASVLFSQIFYLWRTSERLSIASKRQTSTMIIFASYRSPGPEPQGIP